jgi:hypothetical protein
MTGGDNPVVRYLETKFQEVGNRLSPDSKWMAYGSDESGHQEVYVQTFPITDRKWPVSRGGGSGPQWRRDGRELFYLAADRKLMAVDVQTVPGFSLGVPRALFQTDLPPPPLGGYAPSRDGQRFLMASFVDRGTATIVVVLNWTATMPSR